MPVAPSGDRVYTANQTSNTVSVIDPASNKLLGVIRLGDPVPGAKVKVAGKSGKTGPGGTVKIKLGPFKKAGHLTAVATRDGYALGKTGVKLKK